MIKEAAVTRYIVKVSLAGVRRSSPLLNPGRRRCSLITRLHAGKPGPGHTYRYCGQATLQLLQVGRHPFNSVLSEFKYYETI